MVNKESELNLHILIEFARTTLEKMESSVQPQIVRKSQNNWLYKMISHQESFQNKF